MILPRSRRTRRVWFRLSDTEHDGLMVAADALKVTVSGLLRLAVDEVLLEAGEDGVFDRRVRQQVVREDRRRNRGRRAYDGAEMSAHESEPGVR